MKKIIALVTALILVLSLAACGGNTGSSTADESAKADVSTYTKDFEGLQKYIADRNQNGTTAEIYYDILGADNGVRYVLNGNAYVEIYDFSKADNATAKAILEDVKDDGVFVFVSLDAVEVVEVAFQSVKVFGIGVEGFDFVGGRNVCRAASAARRKGQDEYQRER